MSYSKLSKKGFEIPVISINIKYKIPLFHGEKIILMSQFKCREAINLDGGGSSALFVDGNLDNRPIGLSTQREIMSSIAVISKN